MRGKPRCRRAARLTVFRLTECKQCKPRCRRDLFKVVLSSPDSRHPCRPYPARCKFTRFRVNFSHALPPPQQSPVPVTVLSLSSLRPPTATNPVTRLKLLARGTPPHRKRSTTTCRDLGRQGPETMFDIPIGMFSYSVSDNIVTCAYAQVTRITIPENYNTTW